MCVKLIIELSSHRTHLGAIEQELRKIARVDLHLEPPSTSVGSQPLVFSISDRDAGCGCSWVTDTAAWEKRHWQFKREAIESIADAVDGALKFAKGTASFRAVWLGVDRPSPTEDEVSAKQLISEIRANRIVPSRHYRVVRNA